MKWKFNLGILAIGAVIFASCSSNDDLFDPEKAAQRKEALYTAAFVQQYGEIAPDQDWGFGSAGSNTVKTRGIDANANNWGTYVDVPAPVSDAERIKVVEWFNSHKNPESIPINWSDFFVQQVYKGETEYTAKNGEKFVGSDKMNQLVVGMNNEHAYNFNNGDCSLTNVNNLYQDKIMLMVNSSTAQLGYSNSAHSGNFYHYYTIQEIDGAYYVGFEFRADGQNPNEQVDPDGYYSDWIVKICPATYKNAQRIIAEDLGASDDFDFNDVVFDVALLSDATVITLRAAGGTLPLYIGNHEYEVHKLFGVPTSTMVNTGLDTEKKEVVIFRLPTKCNTISDVRVLVENSAAGEYYLKANCGEAPQMICVPTTYEWTEERQAIDEKYPRFKEWVGNTAVDWLN